MISSYILWNWKWNFAFSIVWKCRKNIQFWFDEWPIFIIQGFLFLHHKFSNNYPFIHGMKFITCIIGNKEVEFHSKYFLFYNMVIWSGFSREANNQGKWKINIFVSVREMLLWWSRIDFFITWRSPTYFAHEMQTKCFLQTTKILF